MAGNDFVMVQLSRTGIALASGNPLSIRNGRADYTFAPGGSPVRVLTSELRNWLLHQFHAGEPIFEIAPDAPSTSAKPIIVPPVKDEA